MDMNIIGQEATVLGIDIGGTHITAALVDLNTREVDLSSRQRKLVDARQNAENIISSWCEVIENAYAGRTQLSKNICIAMPGPFDYNNGISLIHEQDKFKSLYQVNIKEILADRLNISPSGIKFMNDASCFLQGEAFCGAAFECEEALGFTLGTGLGSAIYKNGIAEDGEMWCSAYKDGIAEDYLSTRWFVRRYKELSGKDIKGVKELKELLAVDNSIQEIFDEFGENLGTFVNSVTSTHSYEVAVLGGNIANATDLFLPALNSKISTAIQIKKSMLGEEANLIGAASCWSLFSASKENVASDLRYDAKYV